jgi:hypothetical protein
MQSLYEKFKVPGSKFKVASSKPGFLVVRVAVLNLEH